MKKQILIFAFLLSSFSFQLSFCQIPNGYYDAAQGLTGQPLLIALHNIIDNHTSVTYSSLYSYFQNFDIRPDNTVWDIYSDIPGGTPPYTFQYVLKEIASTVNTRFLQVGLMMLHLCIQICFICIQLMDG